MLSSLQGAFPPAILALADGTVFIGNSIGAAGSTTGEVVFNTALTGYQEILTDPSYCQQIVTLTYPHIGNYGVNAEDVEATQRPRRRPDHPRPAADRLQLPRRHDAAAVPAARAAPSAIANIDTRKLTRLLRNQGAQNGCILALQPGQEVDAGAGRRGRRAGARGAAMAGLDLAQVVTGGQVLRLGADRMAAGHRLRRSCENPRYHVVAFDYGVKKNILRMLAERGCKVTVVPAQDARPPK